MARKRMISPCIWESFSFSELSDFSKLVFISLISHADDEGRGVAKAATIASMTFPNDENKRVADVKKALSEIALKTSTQLYTVDGREYYALENWLDYQTINKPTKSKLPPPPSVGVGGDILNHGELHDDYGSTTVGVSEDYYNKINGIEVNRITNNNCACAREELENPELRDFLRDFPNIVTDTSQVYGIDYELLRKKFMESRHYLSDSENPVSLKWIVSNYQLIIRNKYKDKPKEAAHDKSTGYEDKRSKSTKEELDEAFKE